VRSVEVCAADGNATVNAAHSIQLLEFIGTSSRVGITVTQSDASGEANGVPGACFPTTG